MYGQPQAECCCIWYERRVKVTSPGCRTHLNERKISFSLFDVLLTVHLSIFISVFNQLDAQNLSHNKFYFMPLHVSSTCAHHQEVKIALHSLWYHQTYMCDDTRGCVMQF